ncbi:MULTISPECIES: acyl-CoA thioesterase [Pseudomonas]|jgi:acyl-CoA thioester hydrolase|uniref:Thioesterase n=1 Tax=Pseudomonas putida S12 TaxID=1215087 RepID=A0AA34WSB3_PSEPU|nr:MULTISPECIES: thioesterase family protein [Pseudomonas]ADR61192.1 Thioesterase superfamily protein [Pseudomonas putida BIRD-1]AJA15093.1 thioesterase [Pseudomonas putida S12]MDW2779416.1 thioesterase family protein [Pseudomonas sp. BEA3.1]RIZ39752.1 thioesterase [Pseudomonas putida]TFF49771.1 acyl-CoA thioesterase [Pseudomonas putida]
MSPYRQREHYRHYTPITTRWHDNDVYGHVNNVVYYSFFDSAVNRLLVREGGLDIDQGRVIALVVSSACDYQAPVAFPHDIEVGLVVSRLGNTSVHYQLAVFLAGQPLACATGRFVHVFVDREGRRPVPVPDCLRRVLSELQPLSPEEQPS